MKLVIKSNTVDLVKSYPSLMYRKLNEETNHGLRTGDVIYLKISDFEKILRNFQSIKPLLEQFASDPKYKSSFWAILNKPCDMVHDISNRRLFDTNLFLCPLQGLLSELRPQGLFKKYTKQPNTLPSYKNTLEKLLNDFINAQLNKDYPITSSTTVAEKKDIIDTKETIKKQISESSSEKIFDYFEDSVEPEEIEKALEVYSSKGNVHPLIEPFFEKLSANSLWKKYKKDRLDTINANSTIELSKDGVQNINELFLNQLDSKGIFYYEPHCDLLSKEVNDFSYFLELEDMLTLKIKTSEIENGQFVKLLTSKRKVGLERNFSDRLQNIMGNYFSKIGTADVTTTGVLKLYDDCFDGFIYK